MKYSILLILFLSITTISFGQLKGKNNETQRILIQRQQMSKGYYYILEKVEKERFYNPEYELSLLGKEDTIIFKTTLNDQVYSMGNPIPALYMDFISVNTGFIYGYESGYGEFPMLYKTTDAGKTWNRMLFEEVESLCPLYEDNFNMFSQAKGIMIVNPMFFNRDKKYNKNHFDYFITNDGGLTWEKKSVDLEAFNMMVYNERKSIQTIFKKNGTIISIVSDRDNVVVLKSTDFGETFKILE